MAFQKQKRLTTQDGRPQGSRLEQREKKIQALNAEKSPEARKARKKMNDVTYRGGKSNLKDWYAPKGKKLSAK